MPARAEPPSTVHRFALLIGNAARDDAPRVGDALTRLGGARREDVVVLRGGDVAAVRAALAALEQRVRDAKSRGETTAVFVWSSGYARGDSLPMDELVASLSRSEASSRVAVLDTHDGQAPAAARAPPTLQLEARGARELLVLSCHQAEEPPEGASFGFHFVTGLLGSADTSRDGRVSVAEALSYAAAQIRSVPGDAQGELAIDASGAAALVLSDVRGAGEGLRIPDGAPRGTYVILDARGAVVAETTKEDGERHLALPPGEYTVRLRQGDRLRRRPLTIEPGQVVVLGEATRPRDADAPAPSTPTARVFERHWSLAAAGSYQLVLDRPTDQGGQVPSSPALGGEVTLHNLITRGVGLGLDASYAWSPGVVRTALLPSTSYDFTTLRLGASVLSEWLQEGRWVPFASAHVALLLMARSFGDPTLPRQAYTALTPGLAAGVKLRITPAVGVIARARLHALVLDIDGPRATAVADVGLLLAWEFQR